AQLPGHGYAVVAVFHEVGVADPVQLHGRHPGHAGHGHAHPGPTGLVTVLPGQELAGEVVVTSHAAHDAVKWNLFQLAAGALHGPQLAAHVLEVHQRLAAAGEGAHHLTQRGTATGPPEVLEGTAAAWAGFVAHGAHSATPLRYRTARTADGRCYNSPSALEAQVATDNQENKQEDGKA